MSLIQSNKITQSHPDADINAVIGLLLSIDENLAKLCANTVTSSAPVEAIKQQPIESQMTQPVIKVRQIAISNNNSNDSEAGRAYYLPSMPRNIARRYTALGLIRAFGVALPPELQDIDLDQLAEKYYTDINGDLQRVLVPLFKQRRTGEHYQDFYQRVGLRLPPAH